MEEEGALPAASMPESTTSPLFIPNLTLTVIDYQTLFDTEPSVYLEGYCPYCKHQKKIARRAFQLWCLDCGNRID